MCEGRYRDGGSALHDWAEPEVLVECPRCSSRAVVVAVGSGRRLTCPSCSLSRETAGTRSTWGVPADPWFGLPLWLRAGFRGHTVWAFNDRHLEALRSWVAADLRERTPRHGAAMSMLEKLPAWMTSAKNRDHVLAVLDRLGERAVV
jgi:hypothetical protein